MAVYQGRTQYPEKLNVGQHVLRPVFIPGKLTGEKYKDLLQGESGDLLEDLHLPIELWYRHDWCPAHNYKSGRES